MIALGVLAVMLAVMLAAVRAQGADYRVTWRNEDPSKATQAVRLCLDGADCMETAVECASKAECEAIFDLPDGFHEVTLYSGLSGGEWSEPSEPFRVTVWRPGWLPTPACRHDIDGNGAVTASDFASFLGVFGSGTTCDNPLPLSPPELAE
jgi:hypothetical protein